MNEPQLLRVVYTDAQIERAQEERVELPFVDVSPKLAEELIDTGQPISLEPESILQGVVERRLTEKVRLIMSANDDEDAFDVEFRNNKDRSTVGLLIATKPKFSSRVSDLANKTFWEAVVCSSMLADEDKALEELERIRETILKRAKFTKVGGLTLTGLAATSTGLGLIDVKLAGIPPVLFIGMKGIGSTVKFVAEHYRRPLENINLLSKEFEKQVRKEIGSTAAKLANLHPVIRYDGLVTTEFEPVQL